MRKSNREITDLSEIADIVRNTDTIRLGINDEKFPYVVPVSFGFDFINGKFTFFFHGAKDGKNSLCSVKILSFALRAISVTASDAQSFLLPAFMKASSLLANAVNFPVNRQFTVLNQY